MQRITMKFILAVLLSVLIGAQAHAVETKNPFPGVPIKSKKKMTMIVAPEKVNCQGAHGLQKCLSVTSATGQTRLLYEGIHGYTHKDGKPATLIVERIEYDFANAKAAPQDVSSVQYVLKKQM